MCAYSAPRCVQDRFERRKSVPLGGQRCPKWSKRSLKGGKMAAKLHLKSNFFKKVPNVSSTHYLQCISHIGTSPKRHFFFPWRGLKEGAHRVVPPMPPRCCKIMIKGLKNAQSGALWEAKGSPMGSECLQNVFKKSSKIELGCRDAPWECPRYPQASPNHHFS